MREIRMYGSEGGVVQTNVLSLPLSGDIFAFLSITVGWASAQQEGLMLLKLGTYMKKTK